MNIDVETLLLPLEQSRELFKLGITDMSTAMSWVYCDGAWILANPRSSCASAFGEVVPTLSYQEMLAKLPRKISVDGEERKLKIDVCDGLIYYEGENVDYYKDEFCCHYVGNCEDEIEAVYILIMNLKQHGYL